MTWLYEGTFSEGVIHIARVDRCVVRNQAYQIGSVSIRQRHNDRKNERYGNGDIVMERYWLNEYFKTCSGTYEQEFNRMVGENIISLRGLKPDAKVIDELVFDVNSAYFEGHGGYEYAKEFFREAYKLAVKEAGGEEYVLSAVMHADERNRALSDQLGYDAYHYHLHVVYVPVVEKEVYFKKNNKNPELAGKLKEVITQVSHSKKWPRYKDEAGRWVNSYSLLQDRFHEHMKAAGYTDFERGERGSTAEHLSALEYKTQKETERAAAIAAAVEQQQDTVAALDDQSKKKRKQLEALEQKTAIAKKEAAVFGDIERMGKKRTLLGDISLSPKDWKTVSGLAKEGMKSRGIIAKLKEQITELIRKVTGIEHRLQGYEGRGVSDSMKYFQALQRAPRRLAEAVADILLKPPEKAERERAAQERKRGDLSR